MSVICSNFNLLIQHLLKKTVVLLIVICTFCKSNSSSAQVFYERTSDSTWKFIGEVGLTTGSYTYDQFAPDFYLEGFRLQLKKGVYYRLENEKNAFRISFTTSAGNIKHQAKQYYEIKDTVNLNGNWNNTGLHIGFEHFLYQKYSFCFYAGADAVYRKHKFTGSGSSMFNELPFQQKINSYAIGTEMFFGVRFSLTENLNLSVESAYSVLAIHETSVRTYPQNIMYSSGSNSNRLSIEPSPFNRICFGYKF